MVTYNCSQGRLAIMNKVKNFFKAKQCKKEVKEIVAIQEKAVKELETLNNNLKLISKSY